MCYKHFNIEVFMTEQLEQQKDFIRPEYSNPVMDMWEFFNDNPHYKCLDYESIKDGVRVFYVVVS